MTEGAGNTLENTLENIVQKKSLTQTTDQTRVQV